jgi:hypothetical protein
MALGDIATALEIEGGGVYGGGTAPNPTIFTNREPTQPLACSTLYGDGGAADTQDFSGDTNGERRVQLRMRDPDPVALETRMEEIYARWTAWRAYPAYYLTLKAAGKPTYNYPPQGTGRGLLYIASVNLRVIQGS